MYEKKDHLPRFEILNTYTYIYIYKKEEITQVKIKK